MSDTVLVQRDGGIATVVLNRPEKLNALTKPMWLRLGAVFRGLISPMSYQACFSSAMPSLFTRPVFSS